MALGKNSMMLQVVVSKDVMAKLDVEREKLGLSRYSRFYFFLE